MNLNSVRTVLIRGPERISREEIGVEDVDSQRMMPILINKDVPGIVGCVGMLLDQQKAIIAERRVGRLYKGEQALGVIHIDGDLSDTILLVMQTPP